MLLDLLLKIETIESLAERETFSEGLYLTNPKFARLCDLCYRRGALSRYGDGEEFPSFKQDKVPYGYNYSQLERIYNKLKVAGFTEFGNDRSLPENVARSKLIQVFESLSDIENQFVMYVLRKEIPWFSRDSWKRAKHS